MQAYLKNLPNLSKFFIKGELSVGKRSTFDVRNPATGQVIAKMPDATIVDVDHAVKAAKQSFQGWRRVDPSFRAGCLFRLADLVQKHSQQLAYIQSLNNGKPFSIAKRADLPLSIQCYRYYAGWVDKIQSNVFPMDGPFFSYTVREPVGVAAQIIPWNFPLLMQAWKLGPALAAGCTVVMKTSPLTPLSAMRVAELINEAGFPKGVVNILSGHAQIGSYLTTHKDIDKVAFTGSTRVGLQIMKGCHAHHLKRVTLQLGGKSPNIITAHADLDKAITQSSMGLLFNTGQCCIAASRTYIHESIYEKYVERLLEKVKNIKVGDAFSEDSVLGPLVSKEQFNKVMSYINTGKSEGANLLIGGKQHGDKGYFVQPTVFGDVTDKMTIAKQQIFGPVMCLLKYKDTDEVIERANNSRYGLGAGVVTQNLDQATEFVNRIRSGTVYINCWNSFSSNAPFGGFRDSGIGRELGEAGLNNYLETKTVIQHRGKKNY